MSSNIIYSLYLMLSWLIILWHNTNIVFVTTTIRNIVVVIICVFVEYVVLFLEVRTTYNQNRKIFYDFKVQVLPL